MNRKQRRAGKKPAKPGRDGQVSPTLLRETGPKSNAGPIASIFEQALRAFRNGDLLTARRLCGAILSDSPNHDEALHLQGALALQSGHSQAAGRSIGRAIAIQGGKAAYFLHFGMALHQSGRKKEAIAAFRAALQRAPDLTPAHNNLAILLRETGLVRESLAACRTALAIRPDFAEALCNLGIAFFELGRPAEASLAYDRSLSLRPDFALVHSNLGNSRVDLADVMEGLHAFRTAICLDPALAEAYLNFGAALPEAGSLSLAQMSLERSLRLNPQDAMSFYNLGNVLRDLGRTDEAILSYRRALQIRPDHRKTISNLLMSLHYLPATTSEQILAAARHFAAPWEASPALRPSPELAPERKLRIGYVSGDFRHHPVGFFLLPVLQSHDRAQFEIFCYSNNPQQDLMTAALRQSSDHWRSLVGLRDEEAAAMIMADRIDLLLDLSGYTGFNRLGVFGLKPAPLQATWLGFWGTTGLSRIDYLITDAITVPPGEERHYSESLLRLDGIRFCYAPPYYAPAPAAPPCLRQGFVTFGSFNNLSKVTPEVLALWAALLRDIPGSRLLLKWRSLSDARVRLELTQKFQALGIDPARLELRGPSAHRDMLAQYDDIDIALDPFPFSGGLTSCEALWMGVPVITLPGRGAASRQTEGFLRMLGRDAWIAGSTQEYRAIAVALAQDQAGLAAMRRDLREQMASSPLCDGPAFAGKLQTAYRKIWRDYCASPFPLSDPALPDRHRLAFDPAETAAWHRLGVSALAQKSHDLAMRLIGRALRLAPLQADHHADLAIALAALGRGEAALDHDRRAITLAPDKMAAHHNLAIALHDRGRFEESRIAYERTIRLAPHLPQPYRHFANLLWLGLGRHQEALAALASSIAIAPDDSEAHADRGQLFRDLNQSARAIRSFCLALALNPGLSSGHVNLGGLWRDCGRQEDALIAYRRALAIDPAEPQAQSNLLMLLYQRQPVSEKAILATARQFAQPFETLRAAPGQLSRAPERRLKIGYVSGDFRRHPVGFYLAPVLAHHDRRAIEIFCYSNSRASDPLTTELRRSADHWRDLVGLPDQQAAARIRADRIDILVDLSGHTALNRLRLFGLKPAPLQLSWLGYWGTTGFSAIDYILSDGETILAGEDDRYSEKILRLPGSRFCYAPPANAPEPGPPPCLRGDSITFGCFNNLAKIGDDVLGVWASLLLDIQSARLLLKWRSLGDAAMRDRVTRFFAARGIGAERLELRGASPHRQMLAEYGDIDIALDPFPVSGGLTSCEALWMGVPLVTLPGVSAISRQTTAFLKLLGREAWIARSEQDYRQIAARLAGDPALLAAIRTELRPQMAASPLCDASGFTFRLENAYRRLWREFCQEAPADPACDELARRFDDALARHRAGALAAAETCYRQILLLAPEYADSWHFLAILARSLDRRDLARLYAERALALSPDHAPYHSHRGVIRKDFGDVVRSMESYRIAIGLHPSFAEPYANLGNSLRGQGHPGLARRPLRAALLLEPESPERHHDLGTTLSESGDHDGAARALRSAICLQPEFPDASNNYGNLLLQAGVIDQAIRTLQRSVLLRPLLAFGRANLGGALRRNKQFVAAAQSCRAALVIEPRLDLAYANLSACLLDIARSRDAIIANCRSLVIQPQQPIAASNLLMALHYEADMAPEELYRAHRRWGEQFDPVIEPQRNPALDSTRRLRIGYLSPDLRRHSVTSFLEPLLRHHHRGEVEIFCYADSTKSDDVTSRLRPLAAHWRTVAGWSDAQLYDRIAQDSIDILVDLAGHTAGNRLALFARRAAPLQVTWLGYPDTTGLTAMDYRLVDAITDPVGGSDRFATEKLLRLADGFLCYQPPADAPEPAEAPFLRNGWVTLGSFNNPAKLSSATLALWARLLHRLTDARLLLKGAGFFEALSREALAEKLARHGLPMDRVTLLAPSDSASEHLALYGDIDIALDPFPYNGATTSCEALWMGVPVITLLGSHHAARVGASLLTQIDESGWIATDGQDYIDIADRLAADRDGLAAIRRGLRQRMRDSSLCDGAAFAAKLETAYRAIWRDHCARANLREGLHRQQRGDWASALGHYRRILCDLPAHADSWHLSGVAAQQNGQFDRAPAPLLRAIHLHPNMAHFHSNYAITQASLGQAALSAASFRSALALDPALGRAYFGLASLDHDADRSLWRALRLQPDEAEAYGRLAARLRERGVAGQAIDLLRASICCKPDHAASYANLGSVAMDDRRAEDALIAYAIARRLTPAQAEIHYNHALALLALIRLREAEKAIRTTLALRPEFAEAYADFGNILKDQGFVQQAIAAYAIAVRLRPGFAQPFSNLLMARHYLPDADAKTLFPQASRFASPYDGIAAPSHGNDAEPDRRLKIGYVSADFMRHPVGYFLAPVLAHHDKAQFEVFCFTNNRFEDDVTRSLREGADHWHSLAGLSDQAAALCVTASGIDILVDLSGHTAGNRLPMFALKPAPLQLSWLGYWGTTGLAAMDYILSDGTTIPPEDEAFYREQVIRMDGSRFCYAPPDYPHPPSAPPCLQNGFTTFGSFGNLNKMSAATIALWSELLMDLPQSRLLLKWHSLRDLDVRQRVLASFADHGIAADRLELRGGSPHAAMLGEYGDIDIALDPFPFSGGLTSCEALWMGLPVITWPGAAASSRQTMGFLDILGLTGWVADSAEDYRRIAVRLAEDRNLLQRVRSELRPLMRASKLCDGVGFTREIETVYRTIWRRWCYEQGKADPIKL